MAGPYSDLTDVALAAEIVAYRAALREVTLGGGVAVVAGEGRRTEFVQSNLGELRLALRELLAEQARRGNGPYGRAIGVEIG
jgi:hypothetical protein